jgi:Icc-related predicted phosphoesterase
MRSQLFAFVTDLHGNLKGLREFIEICRRDFPNVKYLLVGGDLSRKPSWKEDWAQAKTCSMLEAARVFSNSGLKTFFIPGNDDIEEPFPDFSNIDNVFCLRNEVVEIEPGIGLLGFSYVPPTPFLTRFERDEKTIKGTLEPVFRQLQDFEFRVVMCHAPPYGTSLDLAKDWYIRDGRIQREILRHVGCRSIHRLISRYQPDIGLFGHVHESAGVCRVGRTLCVNPGACDKQMNGCVIGPDCLQRIGAFSTRARLKRGVYDARGHTRDA